MATMTATQIWTKMAEFDAAMKSGAQYDAVEFKATMTAWNALPRTEQAKVMAAAKKAPATRHCHGCGLPLNRRGECNECGYMG